MLSLCFLYSYGNSPNFVKAIADIIETTKQEVLEHIKRLSDSQTRQNKVG